MRSFGLVTDFPTQIQPSYCVAILMDTAAFRISHVCTRNVVTRFLNTFQYRTDIRVTCYVNQRTCKIYLPLTLQSRVGRSEFKSRVPCSLTIYLTVSHCTGEVFKVFIETVSAGNGSGTHKFLAYCKNALFPSIYCERGTIDDKGG